MAKSGGGMANCGWLIGWVIHMRGSSAIRHLSYLHFRTNPREHDGFARRLPLNSLEGTVHQLGAAGPSDGVLNHEKATILPSKQRPARDTRDPEHVGDPGPHRSRPRQQ